jgi:uncharacterized repeat protein (TIGR02543 family)
MKPKKIAYFILWLCIVINGIQIPISKAAAMSTVPVYVTQVDAGDYHSIALMSDKTVRAWGSSSFGKLGTDNTISHMTPTEVIGLTNVKAISAGGEHSIALLEDGTVWSWGRNTYGQLGDDGAVSGTYSHIPIPVITYTGDPIHSIIAISAGIDHNLALDHNGNVWSWGSNYDGELGNGETEDRNYAVQVTASTNTLLDNVVQISAGAYFSLALKSNGTIWAWGANYYGQIGTGSDADEYVAIPTQVATSSNDTFKSISAGTDHTLALRTDGTLWAWGGNTEGQLGINSRVAHNVPQLVGNSAIFEIVAAGDLFSLAKKSDGTVWAWGLNDYSQLGSGTFGRSISPVQVNDNGQLNSVISLSVGRNHSLALRSDSTVWGWGNNHGGRVGDVSEFLKLTAVQTSITDAVYISAGSQHNIAMKKDGTVWAWGQGGTAQTGEGTDTIINLNRDIPVQVVIDDVRSVKAGANHNLALKNDNTVWAWGFNLYGQIGNGTVITADSPTQVLTALNSPLSGVAAIAAGESHSIALKIDGTVWAWGDNQKKQVGANGDPYYQTVAVQVPSLQNIIAISAGDNHSLALDHDGIVWAWGYNSLQQLGDGTRSASAIPVKVKNNEDSTGYLTKVIAIEAGESTSFALTNNESGNQLMMWGNDQSIAASNTLTHLSAISAGEGHQLALKSDNTVMSWGSNEFGELGVGTQLDSQSPSEVSGLQDIIAVSAGGNHSLALKNDHTVWAWGSALYGQLGEGTSNIRMEPRRLMVFPAVSSDASLSSLALSDVSLSPDFDSQTFTYTASVPHRLTHTTITAAVNDATATINLADLGSRALGEGDNEIIVRITAENNRTQTYHVNIKRAELKVATNNPVVVTDAPLAIDVPEGVSQASLTVVPIISGTSSQAVVPDIDVQATTSLGIVSLGIPMGTTIEGPEDWNGTIQLPTVLSNDSVTVGNGQVHAAIEVGLPNVMLTFDRAVRLLVPNQAGKSAGFLRNGVFTKITGTITADNQSAADNEIPTNGEAAISVGNDLVIWTKHFTTFVSYTAGTPTTTIYYVKQSGDNTKTGTSWDDAFATLQKALDMADTTNGDHYIIWIAAGTYHPTAGGGKNRSFQMKNNVAVYGGFPANPNNEDGWLVRDHIVNKTILSGDLNNDDNPNAVIPTEYIGSEPHDNQNEGKYADNVYRVFNHNNLNLDASAILDGVTISGGHSGDVINSDKGAGMYNLSSSPKLNNIIFENNYAWYAGGGMYNNNSSPMLTNVTFSSNLTNSFGGGMSNEFGSSPYLSNVTFNHNGAAHGGGMHNRSSSPALYGVNFNMNYAVIQGGGMSNVESSIPLIANGNFTNNKAEHRGGGILNSVCRAILTNVSQSGNIAYIEGSWIFEYISEEYDPDNPACSVIKYPTLYYDGNGHTDGSAPAGEVVEDGNFIVKTSNTLQMNGYSFQAWNTMMDGSGDDYAPNSTFLATSVQLYMLYAKWKANNYMITFKPDGGALTTTSQTKQYESTYGRGEDGLEIEQLPIPARTHYTFDGWYTAASGAGTQVTNTTPMLTALDHELYAKWSPVSYTVSFDSVGGSAVADMAVAYDSVVTAPIAPTKENYTFGGWYKESGLTTAWVFTTDKVLGTTTLYAKWTLSGLSDPPIDPDPPLTNIPVDAATGQATVTPAAPTNIAVIVNGKVENAGVATTIIVNEQKVTTVTVDDNKLRKRLESEGRGAVITIPVSSDSQVVIGELNGEMVKNMEHLQAIVEIKTDRATYSLPALQVNIDAISEQIGTTVALEDIKIRIEIAETAEAMMSVVKNAESSGGFSLVIAPLNFTVKGVYGDKTFEVSSFSAYVTRTITIPDGVDHNKITTGIVVNPEGTYRHVPTKITYIDGVYYAEINSLTNSTYSVIWHPKEFADVANHWAKADINDMGSRLIVSGISTDKFKPDQDITRAEFAAILVRGLGLGLDTGPLTFKDVEPSDWFSSAIRTAHSYSLISGFEDGTFHPDAKITREQAMVMIARAMELTGLNSKLAVYDADVILRPYTDGDQASGWARIRMAEVLQAGIVAGRSNSQLSPRAFITRAEVAAIVKRLLQRSDLI